MNSLTSHEAEIARINASVEKLLEGKTTPEIATAHASLENAKTRRIELQLKQAVKGQFVGDLAPRWKKHHVEQVTY